MIDTGKLLRARYEKEMSQDDVAIRAGIPRSIISRIECDAYRGTAIRNLAKLCKELELTIDDVIKWEEV